MDHSAAFPFLRETLLFLTLTGVLLPLLQRARVNQVIAFLLLGAVVGPFGAGSLVAQWPWLSWISFPAHEGVHSLAELGVIFMMFLIGLELSPARVWALRRWVFGAGVAQVLACAAVIGGLAWAFGNAVSVSVVLGLVLSLSSTAAVMQILTTERRLASPVGQATFSVLMLQDFAVVPLLVVVDVMARGRPDELAEQLMWKALVSVVAVGAILLVGRWLVPRLLRSLVGSRQPEVFVALTLLVTLSIGGLTAAAGLSMALGAFLAGLLLAETEFKHEVELTLEPFKGLLMGLFFMTVGMGIDWRELWRDPWWVIGSVVGLVLIKATIIAGLFRISGLSWARALEGGLLLGQGGEFAFIVLGTALGAGLIANEVGQFMLLVVSCSLVITPALAKLGRHVGQRLSAASTLQSAADDLTLPVGMTGHVVLIGFGRVGELLGDVLQQERVPYLAVESELARVTAMRQRGHSVCWGVGTRHDLLARLELGAAACVVVTMGDPVQAQQVLQTVRTHWPALPLFVRSHDEAHALALKDAGATAAVPETLEAALSLAGHALAVTGVPEGDVSAALAAQRRLREMKSSGER